MHIYKKVWYLKHSSDTTILIVLLGCNIVHYSQDATDYAWNFYYAMLHCSKFTYHAQFVCLSSHVSTTNLWVNRSTDFNPCLQFTEKIDILYQNSKLLDCSITVAGCSIRVYQSFTVVCILISKELQYGTRILPTILVLCSMLSGAYYAQNYVRRLDNGCYARHIVLEKNKEIQEDRGYVANYIGRLYYCQVLSLSITIKVTQQKNQSQYSSNKYLYFEDFEQSLHETFTMKPRLSELIGGKECLDNRKYVKSNFHTFMYRALLNYSNKAFTC